MKRLAIGGIVVVAVLLFFSRNALLHRSASNGHTALMSIALLGANIDAHGPDGNTPLLSAVEGRHLDAVKKLIGARANVDKPNLNTGMTPLMVAARLGDEPIVDALLAAGASVSARDKDDRTAYWYAFNNNRTAIERKVRYVREAEATLQPPSGPAPPPGSLPALPSGWNKDPAGTRNNPITITDTTGWQRNFDGTYTKKVSEDEKKQLVQESQRINDDAARNEANAKADAQRKAAEDAARKTYKP